MPAVIAAGGIADHRHFQDLGVLMTDGIFACWTQHGLCSCSWTCLRSCQWLPWSQGCKAVCAYVPRQHHSPGGHCPVCSQGPGVERAPPASGARDPDQLCLGAAAGGGALPAAAGAPGRGRIQLQDLGRWAWEAASSSSLQALDTDQQGGMCLPLPALLLTALQARLICACRLVITMPQLPF